jgi:cytochrome c biogenesis protein CcmG, thiol:disulfide interchange protein DsbE
LRPTTRLALATIALVLGAVVVVYFERLPHSLSAVSSGATKHQLAPDFTLPTPDGRDLQLSSYRGKVVLLDFWATWCDPCREEIPHFVELQQKYGNRGLQIIGVSMDDSPEPVRPFYQRFHMNYPVVMGTAKTGELYGGILGLPISFLIGRDGRIYAKHIGATDASVFEREIKHLIETP